jgi:hypothetical protein
VVDTESHYRHLVYAGCAVDGSGCWLFRDGIFTYDDLAGTLPDCEQGKQSENRHVAISAFIEGKWSQTNLSKLIPRANVILHSYIKARDKLVSSAVSQFVNKISSLLTEVISRQTSAPKEAVIADEKQKFSRPKLLIFPANTSVSAIVGLPGFTFGYADCGYLKPRYSESMLHNLDAVDLLVVPNVSFNKALNLTSFQNGLSPMHILLNDFRVMNTEKPAHKCVGSERGLSVQFRHLLDGLKCALRKSNISSETCILPSPTNNLPSVIKLYQKVGMGSADLLLIHPVNFKEVKQSSDANKCDCLSSVFVWKPFDDDAKVLRIFFPGTAPICKVYEGLERLRGNAMFEAPSVQHKNLATKMSMKQEFSPKQVQQQAAKFAVTKSAVKSATAIAGKSVGSASAKPASKATVVSKTKDNLKHSATVKTNSSKHVSDAGKVAVVSNRRQQTEKLSITTSEPLSSSLSIPNQSITPSEMETPGQTDNSADYPVPAVVLVSQEKDANCPEIHTYDDTDGWATTDSLTVQTTIVTEGCENEGKPLSNELGKLPHSNVASYTAEGQVIESAKFATELPRNVETPDVRCDSKVQSDGVQELDSKSNFNYMVETIREEDDSAGSGWTALCDASTSEVNDQQSTKSTVFNADDVTQFAADDDLAQDSETENFAAEIDESVSCKDSEHDVILLNRQGSISEGGEVNDCTVDKRLLVEVSDNPDLTETSDSIEPGVDDANVGADNTDRNSETVNKFNVGSVFSDNARSFENVSDANAFYQNSGMASSQESLKSEERVIAAYDDMVELVCSGDDVKKSLAISDDDDAVETPDTELTEDMTTNGDENIVLEAAADCLEESIASSAATDHLAESLAVTTSADGVEEKMASATVTDCLVYDILGVSEPAENIVTDSAADDFEEKLESATVAHCLAENIVGVPVIAENILAAMPSGSLEEDIARATGSDSLAESLVLIPVPRENAVINTAADNLMQNIRMVAGTDEDVKAPVDSLEENIAVVVATDYCAYDVSPVPAENMITSTSADRLDDEIGSTATNDCPAQNIIGVPVIAENFETNTAADSLKENSASAAVTDYPAEQNTAAVSSAGNFEENIESASVTDCLAENRVSVPLGAENIEKDTGADNVEEKSAYVTATSSLAENIVVASTSEGIEEVIASDTATNGLSEDIAEVTVHAKNIVTDVAANSLAEVTRSSTFTDSLADNSTKTTVADSLEDNKAIATATDFLADDVLGVPVPAEDMITSTTAESLDDEIGSTAASDYPAQNIPVIAGNFETNTAADSLKENSASAIETDNCSQIDVNKEACSPCIDLAERENAESLSEHEHSDLLSDFNKMNCEIIPQVITVCEDNECEKTDSGAEDANGVIACEISVDEAENGTDVTKCVSFVDDAGVDSHVVASSSATNIDENVNIDGTMVIHVNSNEEGINNETSNRVSNVITDTANLGQNALKPSEGVDDYGAAESTEVTVEDASDATVFKSNADIDSDRMEINSEMPAPTDTDFNTHNAFEDTAVPEVGHVNTGCSETFDGHNGSSSSNVINDHMKSADVFVEGRVADVTVFDDDVIKNNNFDPFGGGVIDEACSGKRDEMNQNCNEEMSRQTGVPDINDPRNQTVTDAQTSVDEAYFQVCSPNEIIDHIDTAADRSDVADSSVDEDYKLGNGTNKLAASENDTGFKNETLITASTSGTNPEPVEDTGVTTNSEDTYVSMEIVQLAITCTDSANIQSDVAEPSAEQDALTNRVTLEITGAGAAYAHAGDDDVQKSIANEEHHETGHLEIADENGETFSTVSDPARTTDTLTPCTDAEVANIPKSDNTIATTGTVDGSTDIRKNEDTTAQGTMECITDPTTQPNDETVSVTASETVMDSDSGDRHHDDTDNQKIKPVSSDVSCASHTILNGSRLHGNTPCDVQYVDSEDTRYSQSSHSSSVTSESNDTNICTYTTNATDHPSSSCHEDEPVCCEIAARFEHTGDHDVSERNTENAEETSSTGTTDNPFVEEKDSIILQAGVPDYSSLKERGGGLNAQSTSCDYLDLVSSDTQPNLVTLDSEEDAVPCDSQETLMTYSSDRPDHDVDRATGGIYASADAQKQDSEDELSKVTVDKFSSLHIEADERLMTEENINEATGTWQQLHGLQTCDEQLVQENPAIMEEPKLSCELSACCSEESSALNSDSHLTKSALESRSDKEVKCETESTSEKSDHSTYTGIHENNIRSIENFGVKGDLPLGDTQLLEGGKHDDVAQQSHTNTMEDNSGTLHIAQRTKEIACAELDDHLGDAHYCCKTGDTAQFVPPADASICSTVAENSIKSVGLDVAEIGKAEIGEPDANNKSITFDPIAEWGEPMALPAPATVSANKNKQGKGKDNDEQPKSTQSAATPPKSATVKSSLGPLKSNKLATKPTLTSPRHSVGERLTASRDIVRKGEKSAAESVSASKKASPSVRLAGIESDQIQVSLICIMDDTQIYRQSYVSYPFGPVY